MMGLDFEPETKTLWKKNTNGKKVIALY